MNLTFLDHINYCETKVVHDIRRTEFHFQECSSNVQGYNINTSLNIQALKDFSLSFIYVYINNSNNFPLLLICGGNQFYIKKVADDYEH